MAIPEGITTAPVAFGKATDFTGRGVTVSIVITPSHRIVWDATGDPLVDFTSTERASAGAEASISLPHTDQPGFVDINGNPIVNWHYVAAVSESLPDQAPKRYTKMFQLPSELSELDLDRVPADVEIDPTIVVPFYPVTSVNGESGAVEITIADLGGVPSSRVGQPDGVASLDSSGRVPAAQLPTTTGGGALDVSRAFAGQTLQVRGNSWVDGGGEYAPPYTTLLPAALGFAAISGKGLNGRRAQDNAQVMVASSNPLAFDTSFMGPLLVNDLGNNLIEPDVAANRSAAWESLRVILALAGATRRVEQSGWVYRDNANGESWGPDNAQAYASGGSIRAGFFTGLQVDIPVTAGTSYLLCHGVARSTGGRGATIRVVQNGVQIAAKSLDDITIATPPPNEASSGVSPAVVRLPNLVDGIVTVTVDQMGVAGAVALIDALLPQSPTPRLVMVTKPPTISSPSHQKPALAAYLRGLPDAARAEFGDHVFVIDPEPGWNPATMLGADGLHPTVLGTQHVRDAFILASRSRANAYLMRQVFGAAPEIITTPPPVGSGGGYDNGYDTGY